MRRRIVTLALISLLATGGCTSVTPERPPARPAQRPLVPTGGEASPLPSTGPPVEPAAKDALVAGGSSGKRGHGTGRPAPERPERVVGDGTGRRPAPPVSRPREPVRRAPAAPPRARPPKPAVPEPRPRPRPSYNMDLVCDMADGVTDSATLTACRGIGG